MAQGNSIKDWSWAVCKPPACTQEDLSSQLQFFQVENSSQIHAVFCKSSVNYTDLLLHALWYSVVFLLLLLVFAGTYIEHKAVELPHQSIKSVCVSFSLITNWKALLATTGGRSIGCINGIRVISQLSVFALHSFIHYFDQDSPIYAADTLSSEKTKVYSTWFAQPILRAGGLAVDAFFLLSGIVLALEFINDRKAQVSFSYFQYVAKRYLRLTPPYLFVILTYMTVLYDIGSGPAWEDIIGKEKNYCIKNWWTNLLYINNYIGAEICVGPTWFLAANMQMYWVAPIFLFILYQNRKFGIIFVVTACVASYVITFLIGFLNHFFKMGLLSPRISGLTLKYYTVIYFPVETRVPPFLIGLLFGYFLEHFRKDKAVLSKSSRMLGCTLATLTIFLAIYFQLTVYTIDYGELILSLYESLHRSLFAIAVGWIIFICNQGYGGLVDSFLSHRYFEITSRLTYCFYLLHYIYLIYEYGTYQQPLHFSYFSYFRDLVFGTFILYPCAAVLALTLEFPFGHLSKMVFKKKKEKSEITPTVTYRTF